MGVMQKKREISEYREKLNKTLASPELTNEQTLKNLITQQLNQECNEDTLDQRVANLSSILEKLRSVSTKDQDLSNSSKEVSYGDWKVKHEDEDCRVMYRQGLEGSPFHTLLVEGYMDGPIEDCLCVSWESSLYEKWWPKSVFPAFRILQTKCLQKFRIDEQICLVRMKVPWPMTDREAIVQFFLFEYFKEGLVIILLNSTIGSVAKSEDYSRVLVDPLYTQIRQALYLTDKTDEICQANQLHSQEPRLEADMAKENCENESVPCKRDVLKIVEEEDTNFHSSSSSLEDENVIVNTQNNNGKTRFCISPEVKQALGTLERVISMVRKSRKDNNNNNTSSSSSEEEEEEEALSSPMQHLESFGIVSSSKVCIQDPNIELLDEASVTQYHNTNRRSVLNSLAREGNKIAPASPEIDLTTNSEVPRITISQATTLFSQSTENSDDKPSGLNGGKSSVLQRKRKPGCYGFRFWTRRTLNWRW